VAVAPSTIPRSAAGGRRGFKVAPSNLTCSVVSSAVCRHGAIRPRRQLAADPWHATLRRSGTHRFGGGASGADLQPLARLTDGSQCACEGARIARRQNGPFPTRKGLGARAIARFHRPRRRGRGTPDGPSLQASNPSLDPFPREAIGLLFPPTSFEEIHPKTDRAAYRRLPCLDEARSLDISLKLESERIANIHFHRLFCSNLPKERGGRHSGRVRREHWLFDKERTLKIKWEFVRLRRRRAASTSRERMLNRSLCSYLAYGLAGFGL